MHREWVLQHKVIIPRVFSVLTVLLLVALLILFRQQIVRFFANNVQTTSQIPDVKIPSIVNGELVLPKIANNISDSGKNSAGHLGVVSATLVPIFDPSTSSGQVPKLVALRILGEMTNLDMNTVTGISPLLRFYDKDNKLLGQKIGDLSSGFSFFGLAPGGKSLYDVTAADPPASDKLEIILNSNGATSSALFDELKIASRSVEVKTARYQNNSNLKSQISNPSTMSGEATSSGGLAGSEIEYYTVAGLVLNTFSDPITEITVYAWIKDSEGKVFGFVRQDFKNDLISPNGSIEFRINLLPFRVDEKYDSYEVAAWGKRYRLGG